MEKCDAFFAALRERVVPLVRRIGEAPQVDDSILHQQFPQAAQEALSAYLMGLMRLDPAHCGIATTEHPFTIDFSKYDVRITTHYYEDNFAPSMFSVIHEGGHALYEMGIADEDAYTALGGGVSMGIHESQSRFYENIIGRSRGFITYVFPKLAELFPAQFAGRTPEELYRAVNRVEPSLIRIEADELTYALHIMVRYELERKLMNRELTTKELPAEWNRLYQEYLGVDVPDDTHGVLQDSHCRAAAWVISHPTRWVPPTARSCFPACVRPWTWTPASGAAISRLSTHGSANISGSMAVSTSRVSF